MALWKAIADARWSARPFARLESEATWLVGFNVSAVRTLKKKIPQCDMTNRELVDMVARTPLMDDGNQHQTATSEVAAVQASVRCC